MIATLREAGASVTVNIQVTIPTSAVPGFSLPRPGPGVATIASGSVDWFNDLGQKIGGGK